MQTQMKFQNNSRSSDPESSHLAGEEITKSGNRKTQCDAVLDAVAKSPNATARELAAYHHLDRHSVSRRLADLCSSNLVRKAKARQCDIGKRLSCTWVVVDKNQAWLF